MIFNPKRSYETYYVEIDPEIIFNAEPHQGNVEEHILVFAGQMRVRLKDEILNVKSNNFIRFQADCNHQ